MCEKSTEGKVGKKSRVTSLMLQFLTVSFTISTFNYNGDLIDTVQSIRSNIKTWLKLRQAESIQWSEWTKSEVCFKGAGGAGRWKPGTAGELVALWPKLATASIQSCQLVWCCVLTLQHLGSTSAFNVMTRQPSLLQFRCMCLCSVRFFLWILSRLRQNCSWNQIISFFCWIFQCDKVTSLFVFIWNRLYSTLAISQYTWDDFSSKLKPSM